MRRCRAGWTGGDGDAVGPQHVADFQDQREDLAVPVLALLVPGPLLGLDRHPVLGEHALGEPPDERPGQVAGARYRRLLDHEQAVHVVGALRGILGYIRPPERERRRLWYGYPVLMVTTSGELLPPMPSAASRLAPRSFFPPAWVNRYRASTDSGPLS